MVRKWERDCLIVINTVCRTRLPAVYFPLLQYGIQPLFPEGTYRVAHELYNAYKVKIPVKSFGHGHKSTWYKTKTTKTRSQTLGSFVQLQQAGDQPQMTQHMLCRVLACTGKCHPCIRGIWLFSSSTESKELHKCYFLNQIYFQVRFKAKDILTFWNLLKNCFVNNPQVTSSLQNKEQI